MFTFESLSASPDTASTPTTSNAAVLAPTSFTAQTHTPAASTTAATLAASTTAVTLAASTTAVPTPAAASPNSQPAMRCDSCLKEFENLFSFWRHQNRCRHLLYSDMYDDNGNAPIILRPPPNLEETRQLLESTLCPTDIVYLCQLQSWCLKGYYPLVFPGKGCGSPVLREYSCGEKSTDILKTYLKDKRTATLPKNVIIKDENNRVNCLLRGTTLKPTGFNFTSEVDSFLVYQNANDNDETLSCDENDSNGGTDASPSGHLQPSDGNNPCSSSRTPDRDDSGLDSQGTLSITLNHS